MRELLTAPFAVAAALLCVAGAAKARSPAGAGRALATAGLPGHAWLVRVVAACEVALGVCCLLAPGRVSGAALACCYLLFAALALLLARRRAACGCFGAGDAPASAIQSALSAVLGSVAIAAMAWTPRPITWMLGRSPTIAIVFVVGMVGSIYAAQLAYIHLPRAWGSWSAR